jgi:hypothetical protein
MPLNTRGREDVIWLSGMVSFQFKLGVASIPLLRSGAGLLAEMPL